MLLYFKESISVIVILLVLQVVVFLKLQDYLIVVRQSILITCIFTTAENALFHIVEIVKWWLFFNGLEVEYTNIGPLPEWYFFSFHGWHLAHIVFSALAGILVYLLIAG